MHIEVVEGDATVVKVDVLALKYAQARYGLDRHVYEQLVNAGIQERDMSPPPGDFALVTSPGSLGASHVLWVGTQPLSRIMYPELRELARTTLTSLFKALPEARSLALTLHGANFGLDEGESFVSMIAGLDDAVQAGSLSPTLSRVLIVESGPARARYLRKLLHELLPEGTLSRPSRASATSNPAVVESSDAAHERLRAATATAATRPHIFVAMPFAEEFRDVYDYAIQNAVNRSGYKCERPDVTAFTGDILAHVQKRIGSAALVVADLSGANPNVYLEVGYAWGRKIPCVLLVRAAEELKFDVRGQRCLVYTRIMELEQKLYDELAALRTAESNSALQLTWPSRTLE